MSEMKSAIEMIMSGQTLTPEQLNQFALINGKGALQYPNGTTLIMFVPPGWIIGGTIVNQDNECLEMKDIVYIESVANSFSSIGDIAMAKTAAELKKIVSQSYPIPNGTKFRKETLLIQVPCVRDLTPLARQKDGETVKKAGGL